MPKLTINLTDRTYRAFNDEAARRGCSISALAEEILETNGLVSSAEALEIAARARSSAGLSSADAMAVAVRETRLHRANRSE